MIKIKITKAIYYDSRRDASTGDDVAKFVLNLIKDNNFIYEGRYNDIFPDNFKNAHKRLLIEIRIYGIKFSKTYEENAKINLLNNLKASSFIFRGIIYCDNILKNLMKARKINPLIKWIFIFFISPLLLSALLLNPNLWFGKKISIPKANERFFVYNPTDNFFSDLIKQLYGTDLTLNSLRICLYNNNKISNEEIEVKLPSKKDPEAGAMQITMNYEDGSNQTIYALTGNSTCSVFPLKVVKEVRGDFRNYNVENIKTFVDISNSYIKYSLDYYELIIKILIIFFGWLVFAVNFWTSIKLISGRKND